MLKPRRVFKLFCLVAAVALAGVLLSVPVAAAGTTATYTLTRSVSLNSKYPSISADSGSTFSYDVNIVYVGTDPEVFTLDVTAPQGWTAYATSGYPAKEITSIEITPTTGLVKTTEIVTLNLSPNAGRFPDPGEYPVSLTVTSDALTASITLNAIVKAKYVLSLTTPTGNLATEATTGKENHFTINVVNSGTAAIDELVLFSSAPSSWVIAFSPAKIDYLAAGQTQQVDVVITPTRGKTINGDYLITFEADNGTNIASMDVRVTVETPSILGWLAFIMVIVVIAGLVVLFVKLGRR
jgi:uncharacterized membrane protein